MRDFVLFAHIILGLFIIILSFLILYYIKNKSPSAKFLSIIIAGTSWLMIIPSAILYLLFYPATKTVIKAGSWPWAHSIIMETKEHWGIFIPLLATVAAVHVYNDEAEKSKKWWILLIIVAILIGVMGRIVKIGALK